jgi:cytochrome P450
MRGYFRELVAARYQRMAAGDFLTSVLVAAEQENIPLDDLVTHLLVLFWAGFETTAHFLGNGLASLLRHPRQLAALRAGRYSVRSTLHEMLRFDAPVTTVTRLPAVPLRLGHLSLAAGDPVLLAVAAANRDPTVHDAPNDFRPDRRPVRHLSFGSGVHACLGAGLALLEGEALFRHLISRYRVLDFAGEPVRRRGIGLRGFDSLPVLATA